MRRTLLKSKIHRATVTRANLHYEGSVTVDAALLEAADVSVHELVHVWDVTRGARLTTYAVAAPAGSGEVCINGAAAHLVHPGDVVIIAAFAEYEAAEIAGHRPRVVAVDGLNQIVAGADPDVP